MSTGMDAVKFIEGEIPSIAKKRGKMELEHLPRVTSACKAAVLLHTHLMGMQISVSLWDEYMLVLQEALWLLEYLYTAPVDSEEANAVRTCDSNCPMSMYVSKLVSTAEKGRFITL